MEEIDEKTYLKLSGLVHKWTGITLAPNRKAMLQGRLQSHMRKIGVPTYSSYMELLETDVPEKQKFINLVTTNETYFFRTPRIWDYIEKDFLPAWYVKHPQEVFTVWSAAASTGEEAHSLGILLHEFKLRHPSFQFRIVGTDISEDVLKVAEVGAYAGRSIEQFKKLHPGLFEKYFKAQEGEKFTLPKLSGRIKFLKHNLFNVPAFKDIFDLVLVRNVLIYFKAPDQEKVLANIAKMMKPNSVLVIGESESITQLNTDFKFIVPLIYSFDGASSVVVDGQSA